MHVCTSSYLGVIGISSVHLKGHQFPYKLQWTNSHPRSSVASAVLTGSRSWLPQVNTRTKVFRVRKMSSHTVGSLNNVIVKENSQELKPSSEYEDAMEALSSLITRPKRGVKSKIVGKYDKLERMSMYIKILGLEEHISCLKIIHVAGTKGKGSTCTFSEAILRECGFRTGLFTSPHLIDVRERFRLDGLDISEEKFLLYFWDCWNQLKESVTEDLPMPPLFQFLTVLAFKIFVCEKVDVAIIEVGLGGQKDSTNVIKEPVVCGIASLGMDHMETLGNTLAEIASHKAGIFKPHVPAFTVPQLSEAMTVLQERAKELTVPLQAVPPLDIEKLNGTKLSLSGDHQLMNAGLAVSLCKSWLATTGNWGNTFQHANQEDQLPEEFLRGLSTARLSGRAQIVQDSLGSSAGDLIFYLDGAHSPESIEACGRWFSKTVKENKTQGGTGRVFSNGYAQYVKNGESSKISKQILLFNCMDVRDPQILLPQLRKTCGSSGTYISKAIFVPSISTYNKVTSGNSAIPLYVHGKDLSWQFSLQRIWEKLSHGKDVPNISNKHLEPHDKLPHGFLYQDVSHCSPSDGHFSCSAVVSSLPLTIRWLRDCVRENPSLRLQVLVTGSLHLVGDVLKLLRR